MKQFFKFMFASMIGFLLSLLILLFVMMGIFASMANFAKKETVVVASKSVLHLTFDSPVIDRGGRSPFDNFDFMSFSVSSAIGLNDLINDLKKAREDENIEGIFLDLTGINAGWASIGEIRKALADFRESGKFILSYGEIFTQKAYYLASIADEIYLNPEGVIDFRGINAEQMFFKNMLGKLGIDPQLLRHGKYKSAGEPFFLEKMSDESREQLSSYVGSIWNNVLGDIAEARGQTINQLNASADAFVSRNADGALEANMIDGIVHRDEMMALINQKLDQAADKDIRFVSLARYNRAPLPKSMVTPRSRDKIAVIYASGSILSGQGAENVIGSAGMSAAIREARLDSTVKAIVFRINSPGGSALASDVILREVKLATAVKPVIASMGDVAASGGYYIACAADKIIASPNTVTGSIGVYGMIPNMQHFFNQKLGITFDNVKTNELADIASISRPLTAKEREVIMESVEQVYETFVGHVAEGREMPADLVDELGQGRVWSGAEARQNGLIDDFGGLSDAIALAAEMASLENYRVVDYPSRKDFLTQLMEDFGGVRERRIQNKLGAAYHYYKQVEEVNSMTGIQARMPFDLIME